MAPRTADEIQDDHESVIGIRLVCQMGLAGNKYNPTFSTNHWSIFLLLQGNLTVRANMGADDSSTGILHWSTQNYKVFKSSVRSWDYPVLPGVEVSRFARTIYDLGRHEYDNSGTDSGYRWWCFTVLSDFARGGLCPKKVLHDAYQHLRYQYHKDRPANRLDMVKGTFRPIKITGVRVDGQGPQRYVTVNVGGSHILTQLSDWHSYVPTVGGQAVLNHQLNVWFDPAFATMCFTE